VPTLRTWLNRLPRPIIELLRLTRTAALWLLEPLDWIHRRVTAASDRGAAPPLWLKRHSGPIWAFDRAAGEIAATIAVLGLLRNDDRVLDIGCGCGSMALEFQRMLGESGSYIGFDVHKPSIAWCRARFAADARFRFELADLRTAWSGGRRSTVAYRFPVADGDADFVLAKSVFTHFLEPESQHYLGEVRRVLRPGRAALLTAFLLQDGGAARPRLRPPDFTFPYGGPHLWWRIKARRESTVAYEEKYFVALVEAAQLRVDKLIPGYWTGRWISQNAQDLVIVSRS